MYLVFILLSLSFSPSVQRTELLFQRSVSAYLCVMEVGRQLFSVSDMQIQTQLQTDLATLQEDWEQCLCMLGKRKMLTSDIIKVIGFEMVPFVDLFTCILFSC